MIKVAFQFIFITTKLVVVITELRELKLFQVAFQKFKFCFYNAFKIECAIY